MANKLIILIFTIGFISVNADAQNKITLKSDIDFESDVTDFTVSCEKKIKIDLEDSTVTFYSKTIIQKSEGRYSKLEIKFSANLISFKDTLIAELNLPDPLESKEDKKILLYKVNGRWFMQGSQDFSAFNYLPFKGIIYFIELS